jgi:serine/threonine protein kinase
MGNLTDKLEPTDWHRNWDEVASTHPRLGGQAHVIQIRRRTDGQLGALKRLHPHYRKSEERRFRMKREVDSLSYLAGAGTPILLEDNLDRWRDPHVELYAVTEWIAGPTLGEYVHGEPLPLDEALRIITTLAQTLHRCHEAGILHRDIKPDNVILRDPVAAPFLVDFGMAWAQADDDAAVETSLGHELGNRFLRLPEHAPGVLARDERSDVAMLVGALLFLLTGHAPRMLRDQNELPPYETLAQYFRSDSLRDPRWRHVMRVVRHGLQYSIGMRFQSAAELLSALDRIEAARTAGRSRSEAITRLLEVMANDPLLPFRQQVEYLGVVHEDHLKEIIQLFRQAPTLEFSSKQFVKPTLEKPSSSLTFRVGSQSPDKQHVDVSHIAAVDGDRFILAYQLDGGSEQQYYAGPVTDLESLRDALRAERESILTNVIDLLADKHEAIHKQRRDLSRPN